MVFTNQTFIRNCCTQGYPSNQETHLSEKNIRRCYTRNFSKGFTRRNDSNKNKAINVVDFLDLLKDDCNKAIRTKLCPLLVNTDKARNLMTGIMFAFCSEEKVTTQIMYSAVLLLIYFHLA